MVAQRRTGKMVLVVAVIMFALIAAFLVWAAAGEANAIGSPVSTSATGAAPTESKATPVPTY